MHIGYIGLGKMGTNMVKRMLDEGHKVTAYDKDQSAVSAVVESGATGVDSINELVHECKQPRTIWIMVPHQFVGDVLDELVPLLDAGDRVIDGGNSPFQKTLKRKDRLEAEGIQFMDVGVSGGPEGAREGACMMVGGPQDLYDDLEPLFADLTVANGYGYMGEAGAGHFVKMVHNGIEYGMMQAIAEGFDIMRSNENFDINLQDVASVYNHGSVIESNLIDWMQSGFAEFGEDLQGVSGTAHASGEGRWTMQYADDHNIPARVITDAVKARDDSKDNPNYQAKIIQTLRNQFGGHNINPGNDSSDA